MATPNRVTVPVQPAEAAALQRVGSRLHRLLDASSKFVRWAAAPPAPGSPMAEAFQAEASEPYNLAELLIFSAEDPLQTILLVMERSLPAFSLYTLLRAAGEAVVRCGYLLDPKLSAADRLARSLNERLENLEEMLKAGATEQHVQSRINRLEDVAAANGIVVLCTNPKPPGQPKVHAFGTPRKSLTDLFADGLPVGSDVFRFLSGFTHSRPWAQINPAQQRPGSQPSVKNVGFVLDVRLFCTVLDWVLNAHDENIGCWLQLAGYPPDVWTAAKKGP